MKSKTSISFFRSILAVSFLCLLFPPLHCMLRTGLPPGPLCLSSALLFSSIILLLLPVMEERAAPSFYLALCMAATGLCGLLLRWRIRVWLGVLLGIHFSFLAWRSRQRYGVLRPLFRPMAVWHGVENHARYTYSLLLYLLVAVFPDQEKSGWTEWMAVLPTVLYYVVLLVRVKTGRTCFLPLSMEIKIKEAIKGNPRPVPPQTADNSANMAKMSRLYSRVMALMEQKHVFLDPEFNMNDLMRMTFCNRSDLSRAINVLSGRNFSQFVNYYRVQYSVDLIRKDPGLKVQKLAMMSGFHSTVSFNMAFKLNMGETPSRFQERVRLGEMAT